MSSALQRAARPSPRPRYPSKKIRTFTGVLAVHDFESLFRLVWGSSAPVRFDFSFECIAVVFFGAPTQQKSPALPYCFCPPHPPMWGNGSDYFSHFFTYARVFPVHLKSGLRARNFKAPPPPHTSSAPCLSLRGLPASWASHFAGSEAVPNEI